MKTETQFVVRTEDIKQDAILSIFVRTERDSALIEALKAPTPLIIEGSRGTGKSLLLRVCECEQVADFDEKRVLPVYVSFIKSSLVHAEGAQKFQHWMLASICSRLLRALTKNGLLTANRSVIKTLTGGQSEYTDAPTPLERISEAYEASFRNPGAVIDDSVVPGVEEFKDAVQDICEDLAISRINLLFDEAAHIFRQEQQRQFFTLFRDLRSPYINCNAAVYPGVTAYGATFETSHDARIETLQRDITSTAYLRQMREIVFKQADSSLQKNIVQHGANFDALAYAVSGNPRLLLRTLQLVPSLRNSEVEAVLKEFYRTDVWSEHTGLADKYPGHRSLIDWGRNFIESTAIVDANRKNEQWRNEGKSERTCILWLHRDAPEAVREALRLLSYTGIVTKLDSGVVATRRELGTRYAINIGCLAAPDANPIRYITDLRKGLSLKRFTEYGAGLKTFTDISNSVGVSVESDTSEIVVRQLEKSIQVLDLTEYQKSALEAIGIATVGNVLASTEQDFQQVKYIGPVRSRKIMNVAMAAVLEYLSG